MTDPEATERLVAGRYRLRERLGRGGMGTVWSAVDEVLDRPVAVKELRLPRLIDDDERRTMTARMIREARAAARIDHPNVVTIHDVVEEDGRPWIVMELVRGVSLAESIAKDGPLPVQRVADLGLRLLSALDAAHEAGVLHRDVKPANVLLSHNGRVVLTDFGVASVEDSATLTQVGALVGSPEYLSPEQVEGAPCGPEADLWSLGLTLYEAVEGHAAYRRATHAATLAAVAAGNTPATRRAGPLTPALRALLVRDPGKRAGVAYARALLAEVATGPARPITHHAARTRSRRHALHGSTVTRPAGRPRTERPPAGARPWPHVADGRGVHHAGPGGAGGPGGPGGRGGPVVPAPGHGNGGVRPGARGGTDETVTNFRVTRERRGNRGGTFRARTRRWPRWWLRHWATVLVLVVIASAAGARWLAAWGTWTGMYTIVLLAVALVVWLALPHRRISRSVPAAMLVGVVLGGALEAFEVIPDPVLVASLLGAVLVIGPLVDGHVLPRLRMRRGVGFTLPVPEGWHCTDSASGLAVSDPDRLVSVTVQVDRGIVMPPEESVAHRERSTVAGRDRLDNEDYHRLGLTPIDWRGHDAAEWEYVWRGPDGTPYHGRDLVVRTAGGVRYWLTVRSREDLWATAGAYYDHAREHLAVGGGTGR